MHAMIFAKRIAQKYGIAPGREVTWDEWYKPDQASESFDFSSIQGREAVVGGGRKKIGATDIYETRVADAFLDYWYEQGTKILGKDAEKFSE